ncbi:hypothetical protein LCGC14_2747350, partial [marine sediment metagenome]
MQSVPEAEREVSLQTQQSLLEPTITATPTPTPTEQVLQQSLPEGIRETSVAEVQAKQSLSPFFEQRIIETFEPRSGVVVPITDIFFVDPRTRFERPATFEEEEFFREQPRELINFEAQPTFLGGLFKAGQFGDFGDLSQVIKRERREISQRRPEQQIIGFGLGLGASVLTTVEFSQALIGQPIQTIKSIPSSVILGAEFVRSGALTSLIETEPGFVTGFAVGEVAQFRAFGEITPRRKVKIKKEAIDVQFIKPEKITKTPLSTTFPRKIDIVDFPTSIRQKQQAQEKL